MLDRTAGSVSCLWGGGLLSLNLGFTLTLAPQTIKSIHFCSLWVSVHPLPL